MSSGSDEKLMQDSSIVKAMQKEYKFLTNWPDYHFQNMRGIYKAEFESLCSGLSGNSDYINKQNCVKLFSIVDNILHRGGLKVNDDIWDSIQEAFKSHKGHIDLSSEHLTKYLNDLAGVVQKGLLDDFKKFKSYYGRNYEFSYIAKLFYFTQNVGIIQSLMNSPDNPQHVPCCEFVNQCLEIYRQIKDAKCSGNAQGTFNPSTLCVEMNSFIETYKEKLYPQLKYNNLVGSDSKDPIYGPVKCYYKNGSGGFFSSLFRYPSDMSYSGKVALISFSAFAGSMLLFMLYKYSPLGFLFGKDKKRKRRSWQRMGHPYEHGLHEEMSGFDQRYGSSNDMSYYDAQRMRNSARDDTHTMETASTAFESSQTFGDSTYGSSETLGNTTYGGSSNFRSSKRGAAQSVGGSTYDGSQTIGGSTYGGSQSMGGSTYGGSQSMGGSTYGGSQSMGGSTYGGSQSMGDSMYGSSQTLGDSTYGGSQTVGGSTYGGSQSMGGSTYGGSQTVGGSTYGGSQSMGDSMYGSSQTLGDSSYASSQTLGTMGYDSTDTLNTMRG
ncbi:VIR protein [Plasmodium vivax]|uniref:VIR protein n=2 Tax=Plasmodium vivax TaxID=5855 RepID=A0A1G4GRA6_PLAVI|nr:VIR protein [Plasmodium vivax]